MIDRIENNFSIFIVIAFVLGLAFPDQAKLLNPFMIYVLMGIMYFTILNMDLDNIKDILVKPLYLMALVFTILIITPALFYAISKVIYPELAAAALIIGALPAALASSSITGLLRGNVKVALITTVVTSLIAPFSIPLLIKVFIGVETAADVPDMLIMLSEVIFIPFVLAFVSKRRAPRFIERTRKYYTLVNIMLLFMTVFGPIGYNAGYIKENIDKTITISLYFMLLAVLLHLLGWYLSHGRPLDYKIASTVVVFYNNITLGIVFASNFFSPLITLAVVLYNVPWCIMMVPFQYFLKRYARVKDKGY
ncbi:MAG: bile acid:sodium symporter [Candidatus Methanofastidiosa archaeon]|nr:bile acid:sodium symporter [Candidatus Methanofastidiosa archaeon]